MALNARHRDPSLQLPDVIGKSRIRQTSLPHAARVFRGKRHQLIVPLPGVVAGQGALADDGRPCLEKKFRHVVFLL
jgi:hypothetical protein